MVEKNSISLHDIDYSDLVAKYPTTPDLSTDHIIVLEGVPKMESNKVDKFISVLKKKILTDQIKVRENGFHMPVDEETGMTKGFMFLELLSLDLVKIAVALLHNSHLDKKHVLSVFPFNDLEKYQSMEEAEYVPQEAQPFKPREHLREWLSDPDARDQFSILHGDYVSIYWNDKIADSEPTFHHKDLSEFVKWSPHGTYLTSFHNPGIAIWGGKSFSRFQRFSHPGVTHCDFSPRETFLVTYNSNASSDTDYNCFVWDVSTGKLVRKFSVFPDTTDAKKLIWPILKWSFDDNYFAYYDSASLYIFETAKMTLVSNTKKPYAVEEIQDISWAPDRHHWLSFWAPEKGANPARVCILDIPTFQIVRTKNLFNVINTSIHWHNQSEYLCIRVDRINKKKIVQSNFELFRFNQKDIPVEVHEIKGQCSLFAWEPFGDRFAYIETESGKNLIHFYDMTKQPENGLLQLKHIKTLEKTKVNTLAWSPKGRFIVLAGLGPQHGGYLEFWSLDDGKLEIMATSEHYMATHIEWDPTGRYVITYQSFWEYKLENNYFLYDFKGQLLYRQNTPKCMSILWRPRPPSFLTDGMMKDIKKNLKEYAKIFEEEDAYKSSKSLRDEKSRLLQLREEWFDWRAACEKDAIKLKEKYGVKDNQRSDASSEVVEEWIEKVIEESEEVIS